MPRPLVFPFAWSASTAVATALVAFLLPAPVHATTDEEVEALCSREMTEVHGASELRDIVVKRRHQRPHLYGNADFDDASGVHFLCRVFDGAITGVWFLVPDSGVASGKRWSPDRPHGTAHHGLELDAAAEARTPLPSAVPKVVKAPGAGEEAAAGDAEADGTRPRMIPVPGKGDSDRIRSGDEETGARRIKVE